MKRGKILIDVNDIIGKRLGKLEVIAYLGYKYSSTKGGDKVRHYYVCECDCGRLHIAQRGQLKNGIIYSCGCTRKRPRFNIDRRLWYGNKNA
jgi:hypothetical protein